MKIMNRMRVLLRGYWLRMNREIIAGTVLVVAIGVPLLWCRNELRPVLSSSEKPSHGSSVQRAAFDSLIVRLDKQKEQRSNWAYTALVGIIAVSVFKRVFPIPWVRGTYVLLAVAGTLLLCSIQAGDHYERRVAYLVLEPG